MGDSIYALSHMLSRIKTIAIDLLIDRSSTVNMQRDIALFDLLIANHCYLLFSQLIFQ